MDYVRDSDFDLVLLEGTMKSLLVSLIRGVELTTHEQEVRCQIGRTLTRWFSPFSMRQRQ